MKCVLFKALWVLLTFTPQFLWAQDKLFHVSVGGGFDVLNYTQEIGRSFPGGSVMIEGLYQHFFLEKLGYAVGVQLSYLTAGYNLKEEDERISEEESVVFFDGVTEKQRFFQVDVPVGLYLRLDISRHSQFFVGAGPKISFPLISRYEYLSGSVFWGEDTNEDLSDVQKAKGKNSIDTEWLLYSLYIDMMWSFVLNNSSALHIGTYFSYGLNDLVSNHDAQLGIDKKSILNTTLTSRVLPICFGLKVGVSVPLQKRVRIPAFDGF